MTDNAFCYIRRQYATATAGLGLRHLRTRPYTPRTNGKAERFIQTALREWAYAKPYRSSAARAGALRPFLTAYNTTRPHTAHGRRPPISRLSA
jgi:transposase InsO family protein